MTKIYYKGQEPHGKALRKELRAGARVVARTFAANPTEFLIQSVNLLIKDPITFFLLSIFRGEFHNYTTVDLSIESHETHLTVSWKSQRNSTNRHHLDTFEELADPMAEKNHIDRQAYPPRNTMEASGVTTRHSRNWNRTQILLTADRLSLMR